MNGPRITIATWRPRPTSKAGIGFYPPTRYIGIVEGPTGQRIAETGKCHSRASAYRRAERLIEKL